MMKYVLLSAIAIFLIVLPGALSNQDRKKRASANLEDLTNLLGAFGNLDDLGGFGDLGGDFSDDPDLKNAKSKFDRARKKKMAFEFQNVDMEKEKNICLSTPEEKSSKTGAYLNNFIQGPCHPIVISPGVMGSRLRAQIKDCENLPENILNNCELNCTEANSFEIDLWVDLSFDGPASFVYPKKKCFASIIMADLGEKSDLIEINWFGRTPESRKNDKTCGSAAARELGGSDNTKRILSLLKLGIFNTQIDNDKRGLHDDQKKERHMEAGIDRIKGLSTIIDVLKLMGYREGLTLFVLPYDWRFSAGHPRNSYATDLDRTLNFIKDLVGKKALLIGYSFGGLQILHYLNGKTQEEKDNTIERFISVGVPFTGAFESLKMMIAGSDSLSFQEYGFKFERLRPLFSSFPSSFDLVVKDIFDGASETEKNWWNDVKRRYETEVKFQKKFDKKIWESYSDAFDWFPNGVSTCSKERGKQSFCGFHFFNYQQNPFVSTKKENYTLSRESLKKFLGKFIVRLDEEIKDASAVAERVSKQIDEVYENKIHRLENPGVPITLIYGASIDTIASLNLTKNPTYQTNQDKVVNDRELRLKKAPGDGTVTAESTLTAGFKWAWEFDKKLGKYPVEVIEYCSEHKRIFQNQENYSKNSENVYYGLNCDNKDHGGLLSDEYVLQLIGRIAKSAPRGEYKEMIGVAGIENKCLNLHATNVNQVVESFKNKKKDEL